MRHSSHLRTGMVQDNSCLIIFLNCVTSTYVHMYVLSSACTRDMLASLVLFFAIFPVLAGNSKKDPLTRVPESKIIISRMLDNL